MTTTTVAVPRPRRFTSPRDPDILLLIICVVFTCMSAWATREAMREASELRERGTLCPHPAILNMSAGPAWSGAARIMMCDGTTCRLSQ